MQKDIFVEKIVKRKKTKVEHLFTVFVFVSAISLIAFSFLIFIVFNVNLLAVSAIISVGIVYLTYRIITSFNRDYEYSLTNDELLIDEVISQRRRNRLFIGTCKDFTIFAPVSGSDFNDHTYQDLVRLDFRSGEEDASGWFFVTRKSGHTMMILFEPDDRFVEAFKRYNPRIVKMV
jgi:hypothetical protein